MIARESGVSQTLVSLVLSNDAAPERVAEDTRKRILEAASKLGYMVKGNAMRRRTLALILPVVSREDHLESFIYETIEDFYSRTQSYLSAAAYQKGYSLIVRLYEQPIELTHWLNEWGVDGVLWQASDEKLLEWITQRFPTAQLHFGNSTAPVDVVTANQEEIPLVALDHLHKRGHRKICFIPGAGWGKVTQIRATAFRERAAALGLTVYKQFLDESKVMSNSDILDACLRLVDLSDAERPTAFVVGDPIALVLAREIQQRGYTIPGDISLIGIDNLSAGALYNPPLTSIDVCQREVCDTAVAMLVARIANPELRYQKVFISPSIVERSSVADLSQQPAMASKTLA